MVVKLADHILQLQMNRVDDLNYYQEVLPKPKKNQGQDSNPKIFQMNHQHFEQGEKK
jgi:hypothetical protein